MTHLVELIFNAGLAVLLVATIGYCGSLSRRIRTLQDSRGELAEMIAQFDQATARAMASLADLQTVSKRITEELQLKTEKANFLADDLAFLIEKSTKLAAQLEQARTSATQKHARPAAEPYAQMQLPTMESEKSATLSSPRAKPANPAPAARNVGALEALLNRLALPTGGIAPPVAKPQAARPSSQSSPARTEAERELLEALKGR